MNHLINVLDMNRIENSLLLRRNEIANASSMVFNGILILLILGGFGFFLYTQYHATAEVEFQEKRIPFTPTVWYSATRNIRSEEYGGQPFETETGYGIP